MRCGAPMATRRVAGGARAVRAGVQRPIRCGSARQSEGTGWPPPRRRPAVRPSRRGRSAARWRQCSRCHYIGRLPNPDNAVTAKLSERNRAYRTPVVQPRSRGLHVHAALQVRPDGHDQPRSRDRTFDRAGLADTHQLARLDAPVHLAENDHRLRRQLRLDPAGGTDRQDIVNEPREVISMTSWSNRSLPRARQHSVALQGRLSGKSVEARARRRPGTRTQLIVGGPAARRSRAGRPRKSWRRESDGAGDIVVGGRHNSVKKKHRCPPLAPPGVLRPPSALHRASSRRRAARREERRPCAAERPAPRSPSSKLSRSSALSSHAHRRPRRPCMGRRSSARVPGDRAAGPPGARRLRFGVLHLRPSEPIPSGRPRAGRLLWSLDSRQLRGTHRARRGGASAVQAETLGGSTRGRG